MTDTISAPDSGQSPHVEWHPFDYEKKKTPAPPHSDLVWIVERFYTEGVDLGYLDGYTFRTINGSDDCSVSYWADLDYPEPPAGWDDREDEDDD